MCHVSNVYFVRYQIIFPTCEKKSFLFSSKVNASIYVMCAGDISVSLDLYAQWYPLLTQTF